MADTTEEFFARLQMLPDPAMQVEAVRLAYGFPLQLRFADPIKAPMALAWSKKVADFLLEQHIHDELYRDVGEAP